MSNLQEIWNDGNGNLSDEKLQAYLNGSLTKEEEREIEMMLSETTMESDAVEGLKQLSAETANATVRKLNYRLKQLTHKRNRRTKPFADNKWIWLAVGVVLFLSVVGFFVLQMSK
jgi:hypothetical protein